MPQHSLYFDKIQIPAVLLAEMYSHSLVCIDDGLPLPKSKEITTNPPVLTTKHPEPVMPEQEAMPLAESLIPSLGSFSKKILILVNDPEVTHLSNTEFTLLSKILEAVKLTIVDIALVNTAKCSQKIAEILAQLPAEVVLLFGVEPFSIGFPMRFPHFQLQRWNNIVVLYCPSLLEINTPSPTQTEYKRGVWTALQSIFFTTQ